MEEHPKSRLASWAATNGLGDYRTVFMEEYYSTKDAQYVCRLTFKDTKGSFSPSDDNNTSHVVEGLPSPNKAKTMWKACEIMCEYIEENIMPGSFNNSKNVFKVKLSEWCRKVHQMQFEQVFTMKVDKNVGNLWVASLSIKSERMTLLFKDMNAGADDILIASDEQLLVTFEGVPSKNKKITQFSACEKMWEYIQGVRSNDKNEESVCGPRLKYEALLGDKTLDYLLGLAFVERTKNGCDVEGASELHTQISNRSNNERLRLRMEEIGLKPSGNTIMDASRVEQWVWRQHVECNYDPYETLKRIDPLLR